MKKQIPTEPFWTSGNRKIPYSQLETVHLKNIIKDGYRNPHLRLEAAKRKIKVPVRLVDKLTFPEFTIYLESFASCALSGNKMAEEMMRLYHENEAVFYFELNRFLENKDKNV